MLRQWVGDSGATAWDPRVPVSFVVVGTSAAIASPFSPPPMGDGCLLGAVSVARYCGEKSRILISLNRLTGLYRKGDCGVGSGK